ncbi:RagB/SusD family nutrient uptake outer membrane protein [Aestuariibaculum marinum]|uniref:RagB/SusD family nutrient uptake outer membrane protein n=1 Tax=Aestuariibaculum marinum TaxID=2683592 RepID=A0A8J6Q9Y1_9FLAO|nr:RagB/SusD family nutrient uptake outer membrane protein [Aestuariibaculum marinum]MBD0823971.1 RagB/SusD family nutrient uptake outer membrane protein [Aestuariibaculum marinum]
MKKSIVALITIGLLNLSCDIERNPYDEIAVSTLFESEGALQTATLGNYALLKGKDGIDGWNDQLHRMSEYPGDNVSLSGSTTDPLNFIYNYRAITTNGRVADFWNDSYKVVVGCNVIIESAAEGESDVLDHLLGENYYLRALVYFQMGNIFGRPYNQGTDNLSVPLKLTSDTEDVPNRHTVGEVYDQVISDLLKAESLMSLDKSAGFATKEAAQALLSRVYLYMEDNVNAEVYADKVITSGRYQLLSYSDFREMNYLNPKNNSEAIFNIMLNTKSDLPGSYDWYTVGALYATIDGAGWGEMYPSSTYLNLLNENPSDARLAFIQPQYIEETPANRNPWVYWVNSSYEYETRLTQEVAGVTTFTQDGMTYTVQEEDVNGKTKYFFMNGTTKQYVDKGFEMPKRNGFPKWFITKCSLQEDDVHLWSPSVSRLSEMYLNKAESFAKREMDQQAIDQVNIIRERAGIPAYTLETIPEGKTVLDIVLEERRLELAYEGHRKFDVFRNGQTMNRRYPGGHLWGANPFYEIPATSNRVVEFIPEKQILLQPGLIQND